MIRFTLITFLFLIHSIALSQVFPHDDYPLLFRYVQANNVFQESKTFPDYIPLVKPEKIDSCYLKEQKLPGFNIYDFIATYFVAPDCKSLADTDTLQTIQEHIELSWELLTKKTPTPEGSLIHLPYPYIIHGGEFNEFNYWHTYFSMLGLRQFGEEELFEYQVKNTAYLIRTFGFVPEGNRTYYLSRSQPPVFSLMVQLLAEFKGDSIFIKYLPELEKEYAFWMCGKSKLSVRSPALKRVVLLNNGIILNRYWDNIPVPRPEALFEDIEFARRSPEPDSTDYRNIRAAHESGWGFSSRWLNDPKKPETLETINILPVDLNCLLFNLEKTLAKAHKLNGNKKKEKVYLTFAKKRKKAIEKYFWNADTGFYTDYNWVKKKNTASGYLAGVFPLFVSISTKKHAHIIAEKLENQFLFDGGVVTSIINSGQLGDFPYGYAHLQYVTIASLNNYGFSDLSDKIMQRWISLNNLNFKKYGTLAEKYNVVTPGKVENKSVFSPCKREYGSVNGILIRFLTR